MRRQSLARRGGRYPPRDQRRSDNYACVAPGCALLLCCVNSFSQDEGLNRDEPTSGEESAGEAVERDPEQAWHYGSKGLEYDPANSDTSLWIGLRFQN